MGDRSQFRLVLAHYALLKLAWASGGAFMGAYLLRTGFGIPEAIAAYAGMMCLRFFARFAGVEAVRRIGYRRGLVLGTLLCAVEFPVLLAAATPWGLSAWIVVAAVAESLCWPLCHAVTAVVCSDTARGRQMGLRQAVSALVSVAGPMAGGAVIASLGAEACFAASAAICAVATVPVMLLRGVSVGAIPSMRSALGGADRLSAAVFAADGWICAGYSTAWGLVLFSALSSDYESFGWAGSAAALASTAVSFACGRALDRGGRQRYLRLATAVTAGSIMMRAFSAGSPAVSVLANLTGAAMSALYFPIVMSVIYARAKASGEAYRFHLATEAAWDLGMAGGCLVSACVAMWSPVPSLCVLPAVLGIAVVHACISGIREPAGAGGLARVLSG